MRTAIGTPLTDRLIARMEITDDGCWVFTGAKTQGYGYMKVDGQVARVHRLAYELLVGPIQVGLTLDHLCRNRACFNPDHLEPVTLVENVLRGESLQAKRARQTHCRNDHPLSGVNLIVSKRGFRRCRICTNALKRSAPRRERDLKPCVECAAEFVPARSDALYCSDRCRYTAASRRAGRKPRVFRSRIAA